MTNIPTIADIVIGESAKMKNSTLCSECTPKIFLRYVNIVAQPLPPKPAGTNCRAVSMLAAWDRGSDYAPLLVTLAS